MGSIGGWSFIIGLVIALIVGFLGEASDIIVTILVILGLIVGFLNVTDKEVHGFLVASIALLLAGGTGNLMSSVPIAGPYLSQILTNFAIFVAPAAIVVAVKELIGLARD